MNKLLNWLFRHPGPDRPKTHGDPINKVKFGELPQEEDRFLASSVDFSGYDVGELCACVVKLDDGSMQVRQEWMTRYCYVKSGCMAHFDQYRKGYDLYLYYKDAQRKRRRSMGGW